MRWIWSKVIRLCLLLVAMLAISPSPAIAKSGKPQILFVCQAGTVKSAIARELLINRAAARGIAVHVWSRGITPEDHLSPALADRLRADRIDPRRQPVRLLAKGDIKAADMVIAFDKLPSAYATSKLVSWEDVPSMNSSYDAARRVLDSRIEALLDRIQAKR